MTGKNFKLLKVKNRKKLCTFVDFCPVLVKTHHTHISARPYPTTSKYFYIFTFSEACFKCGLASHIEFYNTQRPHRTLKNLTPYQVEAAFMRDK
ncbi:hypothetical protein [Dysosmobacter sp.]|uniref:hypothetical protein n=1 Tax=Dysosmobacter sp. TaxID=2591382 RepID=UPI003AEF42B6